MKFPNLSRGLCREVGIELFYPEDKGSGTGIYKLARTICSRCVVKDECLEWAIKHEDHGMWGGTTPVDRRRIRRKRNIILEQVQMGEFL